MKNKIMNKNIWYISKYAVSVEDGNPTRQYFLSKYIARKGYNVTLISSRSSGIKNCRLNGIGKKRKIDGINHILINGPEINLGFSLKRILSWFIFETLLFISPAVFKLPKPNIIIVSSLSLLTIVTGFAFKKIYKAKLIFEIRDIWPLSLMELKNISKRNPIIFFLRSIEKFGYKRADYIVGTMPKLDIHIKKSIKKEFKFICIPMGFDPDFYKDSKPLPADIKDKLPDNKFIVAYAGSVGIANCVNEIIEAAKILHNKNTDIYFAILGDGALKDILVESSKGLDNVVFLPKLSKEYVNAFLSSCQLLLNPWQDKKIYEYGVSPNKWIDYMYSEKPIIVSYNGYRSIINEAKCGEFIDVNNAELLASKIFEYYKKSPTELELTGKKGKKYLENNLSFEILTDKLLTVFNS